MTPDLAGKTVVLGVTGGIAAYKAAELCRLLVKAGAQVRVVMTDAACPVHYAAHHAGAVRTRGGARSIRVGSEGGIGHIELASSADLVIIAPATADAIARFAAGMADDLLAAVVLATRAPILLAPAMNTNMWENPSPRTTSPACARADGCPAWARMRATWPVAGLGQGAW